MNMLTKILKLHKFVSAELNIPNEFPDGNYEYYMGKIATIIVIPVHQIYCDFLIPYVSANLIIFASKHFSAAGQKALLVHTTGIWGIAGEHGGKDHEIAIAPAYALYHGYHLIKELHAKHGLHEYWVGIEVTHHGPTSFDIPVLFIETGGTIEEWNDQRACDLIGEVVVEIAKIYNQEVPELEAKPTMIGIGGGHYAPAFIRRMDEEKYYLGHIMPKFVLENITKDLIQQTWERTQANEKLFLIDKKGARSADRHRIIGFIEELGYNWQYSKS